MRGTSFKLQNRPDDPRWFRWLTLAGICLATAIIGAWVIHHALLGGR